MFYLMIDVEWMIRIEFFVDYRWCWSNDAGSIINYRCWRYARIQAELKVGLKEQKTNFCCQLLNGVYKHVIDEVRWLINTGWCW